MSNVVQEVMSNPNRSHHLLALTRRKAEKFLLPNLWWASNSQIYSIYFQDYFGFPYLGC